MNENFEKISLVALSIAFLIISLNIPIQLIPNAGHDDGLFLKLGLSIYNGGWLGNYDNLTFIKGPVFPLFLALNKILGTPYQLITAIVSLLAIIYLYFSLKTMKNNTYVSLIVIVLIILHPLIYPHRVLRDNLYMGELLFLICYFYTFFNKDSGIRYFGAMFGGCILWCFWHTREEGVWIIPTLVLIVLLSCYKNKIVFKSNAINLIIVALTFLALTILLSAINYKNYNFFGINETKNSWYEKSYKIIQSVDIAEDVQLMPVSIEKRKILYSVSASFSKLRNYLEGDGRGWIDAGCSTYGGIYCNDYAGGWFMWAYRDAVASAGYYKSHDSSESFYKSLYDEVKGACTEGLIRCNTGLTKIPVIGGDLEFSRFKDSFFKYIKSITLIGNNFSFEYSTQPQYQVQIYSEFLNRPNITQSYNSSVLDLSLSFDKEISNNILVDCGRNRFIIDKNKLFLRLDYLLINECDLIIDNFSKIYINDLLNKNTIAGVADLKITRIPPIKIGVFIDLYLKFIKIYSLFLLPLLILSLLITLYFLINWKKFSNSIVKFIYVLWFLLLCRSLLLIIIDMIAFPAFNENYILPLFPIQILLIVLPISQLISFKISKKF